MTLPEKLVGPPIADDRLFDCVNVILSYQNPSGGWATYENTRSYSFVEVGRAATTCVDLFHA